MRDQPRHATDNTIIELFASRVGNTCWSAIDNARARLLESLRRRRRDLRVTRYLPADRAKIARRRAYVSLFFLFFFLSVSDVQAARKIAHC